MVSAFRLCDLLCSTGFRRRRGRCLSQATLQAAQPYHKLPGHLAGAHRAYLDPTVTAPHALRWPAWHQPTLDRAFGGRRHPGHVNTDTKEASESGHS